MRDQAPSTASELEALPGDLMIWVLIVSELLVFGAGLVAYAAVRATDPQGFAAAQESLHGTLGAINTAVLVTSGWLMALAVRFRAAGARGSARLAIGGAALLGAVFLGVKAVEYGHMITAGIGTETHAFFTFYYLLTGFHAAHVVAGIAILGLVGWRDSPENLETGAAFWHMVDLVWVLLFPVIYLL